jgi:hypothetical protein
MMDVGGRRCGFLRPKCLRALPAANVSATSGCAKPSRVRSARLIDAELGGGLIKQRVARQGGGRSGGYRTVVAYRAAHRSVFLYGFAKSERDNVNDRELDDLKKLARLYLGYGDVQIAAALEAAELREVMCDEHEKS